MSLVLDASMTLSWYFVDERTQATEAVLEQTVEDGALVNSMWRMEVANGFQTAIRRNRINAAYRRQALDHLLCLPITLDMETDRYAWTTTLHLADRFGLTVYDAAYLELAQRRSMPLATLDKQLRGAASALGVKILGEIECPVS